MTTRGKRRRENHAASSVRIDEARGRDHRPGHLVHRAGGFEDSDRRFAPGPRSRHDAYRHGGDVWVGRGGNSGRGGDRRATRRGLPRLQGAAAQCIAEWDDRRLRAVAEAAENRPTGLLSSPLARLASPCGYGRRLRASCAPTARSCRGASAISMWTISTKSVRSRGRAVWPAIRCSTICASARSSMR